jgi:hypothetical protein
LISQKGQPGQLALITILSTRQVAPLVVDELYSKAIRTPLVLNAEMFTVPEFVHTNPPGDKTAGNVVHVVVEGLPV